MDAQSLATGLLAGLILGIIVGVWLAGNMLDEVAPPDNWEDE